MIGAIIKGRLTTGSTDAQELLDGDLATRALSLLEVADSEFHQPRYGEESRQRLDVALLTFFQHFRKARATSSESCVACIAKSLQPTVCH